MTIQEIFAIEFKSRDLNKTLTIKEYLKKLLRTLWQQGECFSSKRPFGNSDWEYELYIPLFEKGLIKGKLSDDGDIEKVDTEAGNELILKLIEKL